MPDYKKLKDIQFTQPEVIWFVTKNNYNNLFKPLGYLTSSTIFIRHVYSLSMKRTSWSNAAKKAGIQFVCDYSDDIGTLVLGFEYLNSYPDAQKMLWHYLAGNGEEVEVDTEQVLKEDQKLKTFLYNALSEQTKNGKTNGSINIKQFNYGNQNWRNAFGSINIKWTLLNTTTIRYG